MSPIQTTVITEIPLIDELLKPHRAGLGSIYPGYRSHAYRMVNFMRALTEPGPGRDDRLAIVAALHDLPVLLDGNLDYVERAADLADVHLATIGRTEWAEEIRLMITNHHKCRPYRGPHAPLVEAARRADWIDVSFTRLSYGLPRGYVREVAAAFPLDGLYPLPAWRLIAAYAVRNLRDPLPMMRW